MKGGRNQEGYADPTATIAVGRVAKEEREQVECEAADKRAYDLIKVLKYIIKGAGVELSERYQDRKGLQMNESIITKLVKLFDGDDSVKEISLCNDVLPMISAHYKGTPINQHDFGIMNRCVEDALSIISTRYVRFYAVPKFEINYGGIVTLKDVVYKKVR